MTRAIQREPRELRRKEISSKDSRPPKPAFARSRFARLRIFAPLTLERGNSLNVGKSSSARAGDWIRLLPIAVLFLVALTGCGGGSAPADTVTIVNALIAAASLSAARSKAGSAAKHYLDRRVLYLTQKNSGWAAESGFPSLIARIGSEMTQVAALVDERTTTLTGTDPVTPAHRDLQDAAKHLTTSGPSDISDQAKRNVTARKHRIAQIIWRAFAIVPELWAGGDSTLAPTLQKPGSTEILDRRLHSVEVLILNDDGDMGAWSVSNATSGWKDGQRTSMFQYPTIAFGDSADFLGALNSAGLTVAGLAPDWNQTPIEIDYKLQTRVRPEAFGDWVWDDGNYVLTLNAGVAGATALEEMIPSAAAIDPKFEDFFERNWMYCDIMLAALHLEGFRFSRLRRTGSDNDFNAATAAGVTLRPLIPGSGPPAVNILMTNAAQWFEAVAIPHDELQVGDHLIFWNNQFVRFFLGSAWGLENSFVTGIGPDGYQVMLAGHGMPETNEKDFAEDLARQMRNSFNTLRIGLNTKGASGPLPPFLGFTARGNIKSQVVNWAPFGELFGPADASVVLQVKGAWWIRLKLAQLHDSTQPAPSITDALAMIPKSVRVDTSRMTPPTLPAGDFQADYQESIYLPLSVPAGAHQGWTTYLSHPSPAAAVPLVDLILDGSMVPGFFLKGRGQQSTVPVLRPKVQI
jgi:hypothetical protein